MNTQSFSIQSEPFEPADRSKARENMTPLIAEAIEKSKVLWGRSGTLSFSLRPFDDSGKQVIIVTLKSHDGIFTPAFP